MLGVDLPEEYGGSGGDFGLSAVIAEELALAHATSSGWSVHSPIVAHYLNTYADEHQQRRWMPSVIKGQKALAIAMTRARYRLRPTGDQDHCPARRRPRRWPNWSPPTGPST
jgi:alkylation response protein AidB-like acyl-CoA dehydrogenase